MEKTKSYKTTHKKVKSFYWKFAQKLKKNPWRVPKSDSQNENYG